MLPLAAFRSGAVMGFLLAGNGLLVLWITIQVYHRVRICLHCSSHTRCPSWHMHQLTANHCLAARHVFMHQPAVLLEPHCSA